MSIILNDHLYESSSFLSFIIARNIIINFYFQRF